MTITDTDARNLAPAQPTVAETQAIAGGATAVRRPAASPGIPVPLGASPGMWAPVRRSGISLADQLANHLAGQIHNHGLRPGMRLPPVRTMAQEAAVSRFTVVQAYDRLVAMGLVQSRRGSGFYVCPPVRLASAPDDAGAPGLAPDAAFDTAFLLRSMFQPGMSGPDAAGAGLLPPAWLDHDMVCAAVRSVGRTLGRGISGYGLPQGYRPLRQQVASMLQAQDIPAHPDNNLMTVAGVTHGLDLIARCVVRPGDTVLVEDPGWFMIFGRLTALGANVIGVPRRPDGPDVEALARLAQAHQPRLFIVNSAVHNPTGYTLAPGVAYEILRLAERHDFLIAEDDTYADFHPGAPVRLATLDRLNRVMLVGGYSKTLAASLRVGYVAGREALIRQLTDFKLLSALTTPEMNEQVVCRVLAEGQYRRHVARLRARVDQARSLCLKRIAELGWQVRQEPHAGMFVWADCGVDTEELARRAASQGVLLAPGALFSPRQGPSSYMRVAVSMVDSPRCWEVLGSLSAQA